MKLIWSLSAKNELREIYNYYKIVANSKTAKSIHREIFSKTSLLKNYRELGKIEENKRVKGNGYKFLVSGNYKIVYRVLDTKTIFIASVFDCRQNPDKMNF